MKNYTKLEEILNTAIRDSIKNGDINISAEDAPDVALERPRDEKNGDWASTVALRSAKIAGANPRSIAEAILKNIPDNDVIKSIDVAGPGFINFTLNDSCFQSVIKDVIAQGKDFGKGSSVDKTEKINLEYISANPTGPMHIGHGRWCCLGDSIARVMRFAGYDLSEEFYINDHGVQMDIFGTSVALRYMELLGHKIEMPKNCYGGTYVIDIAQKILEEYGNQFENLSDDERMVEMREIAYKMMLDNQKSLCEKVGTTFDTWFSERSLYVPDDEGKTAVDKALQAMCDKGYIYEKDGAVWFESTRLGDDKDRVLIKNNGEMTYFMSDCAYHYNKKMRGFDHLIDLWGADHHGYIKRCECMMEAWGWPGDLEILLGQLVNLYRNGEAVRMSKRTGEMVTFEELVTEVGVDATRYLMLSKSADQQIDFDIEVAKKKDATNPVYYVQYAHARICSILRKAYLDTTGKESDNLDAIFKELVDEPSVDLSVLTSEPELAIMRKMDDFEAFIQTTARDRAPFRLTHFAEELAGMFHNFYAHCKVVQDDKELQAARLALCNATRILLATTLSLLGVSAPEKM